MHRRFLFPLAAGIVGLVAISPILADPPSASAAGTKPKPTKATTSSTSADSASNSGADSASSSGTDSGANQGPNQGNGSGSDSNAGSGSGKGSGSGSSGSSSSSGPNGKGGSTGTSATTGPGSGAGHTSSTTCNPPETNQGPAPQMGEPAQTHEAGPAGTVEVERLSETELRIAKATPNDGWVEQVSAPSGPRVTVKFTHPGGSPSVIRFAASMDQAGRVIHIRVQGCG